jgi:hypothetical protein
MRPRFEAVSAPSRQTAPTVSLRRAYCKKPGWLRRNFGGAHDCSHVNRDSLLKCVEPDQSHKALWPGQSWLACSTKVANKSDP